MNRLTPPSITRPTDRVDRAFTLVELLTVVAIIGILAAILIPLVGSVRESARASACVSNLRQISGAIQLFVSDNKGLFPGGGSRSAGGSSASWQDTLNAIVFEANLSSPRPPLQRLGDTPTPGMIYCPSMEPWGTSPRYPRAYAMNGYTGDANTTTNPPLPTWGPLFNYQKGKPVAIFQNPARTVLLLESERSGDGVGPSAPLDKIVMSDGSSAPEWSANSQSFAFRHKGRMNVVFMDAHLESLSPDEAAKINNNAHFTPTGL
jgi:prepilin-type N-terminal cleavage/methylation domain-containing protein/prepilin-type processing-associated H-X9-DG protein